MLEIIPAYRATPAAALHRDIGVPPVHIFLKEISLQKMLLIQSLDPLHPMRKKAYSQGFSRPHQIAQLLPVSTYAALNDYQDKSRAWIPDGRNNSHDVHLYTDGVLTLEAKAEGRCLT